MKKEVFGIILLVVLFGVGSAVCDDDFRIMKLYAETNSHGALWDNANYNVDICVPNYNVQSSTIHNCVDENSDGISENLFIWLSSDFNSHVSTIKTGYYNTPICYEDLVCNYRDVSLGEYCSEEETVFASVYSETNSHISLGDDSNYPIKICCVLNSVSTEGDAYWKTLTGIYLGKPGEGDSFPEKVAYKGDTVKLEWKDTGLSLGETINVKIYEYDATIFNPDDYIRDVELTADSEGTATGIWTISQADIDTAKGFLFGDLNDFYFKYEGLESNYMEIVDMEKNSKPSLSIQSPKDKQVYFTKTSSNDWIKFSQVSNDSDDSITEVKWEFGGEVEISGKSGTYSSYILESLNQNISVKYLTPGQKTIKLYVKDGRALQSVSQISILTIESPYVLAYISAPSPYSRLQTTDGLVYISADGSYGVEEKADGTIECLFGVCPSQTFGTKNGAVVIIDSSNAEDLESSNLEFSWDFSDNSPESGRGDEDIVELERFFFPGDKWVSLNLKYYNLQTFIAEGSTLNNFIVSYSDTTCNIETGEWISTSGEVLDEGCYISGVGECCPNYEACNHETGLCEETEDLLCEDYVESECNMEDIPEWVALNSVSDKRDDEKTCYDKVSDFTDGCYSYLNDCVCEWDDDENTCTASYDISVGGVCTNAPDKIGTCNYFEESGGDTCEDGYLSYGWSGVWTWDILNVLPLTSEYQNDELYYCDSSSCHYDPNNEHGECIGGENIVPCPKTSQLPFFGVNQMVGALVLIGLIYLILKGFKNKK